MSESTETTTETETETTTTETESEVSTSDQPDPPKTFTQQQVEKIVQDRLAKAQRAAAINLDEILGGVSADEAKTILTRHAEQVEAEKSEAQKAIERANAAEAAAKTAEQEARRVQTRAELTAMLLHPGDGPDGKPLTPADPGSVDALLDVAVPLAMESEAETRLTDAVGVLRSKFGPMFVPAHTNDPKLGAPTPARTNNESKGSATGSVVDAYKARRGLG